MRRFLSLCLSFIFTLNMLVLPGFSYAQEGLILPKPGSMVEPSPAFSPLLMKGVRVHADNPLLFDFIIDPGDTKLRAQDTQVRQESERLIKYFLACLTIPEEDLWVNLSPYEKDRMIPQTLGQTELGRDMLAQDYILKQLTSSLIYPEKQLGKDFWDRVYKKAQELYGTTEIPVNTFNKVWVLADTAKVYEHKDTAYLINSHLQVMLDEDYLAKQKSEKNLSFPKSSIGNPNTTNSIGNQIIRELILPEIEKEVNEGQNFAPLRQIFHSFILATWYKKNLKQALLNQVYSNKAKVSGLNSPPLEGGVILSPEQIYQQYLQAYKKGVFNYIKEESVIPESFSRESNNGTTIPRKYFSGGSVLSPAQISITKTAGPADRAVIVATNNRSVLVMAQADFASTSTAVIEQPLVVIVERPNETNMGVARIIAAKLERELGYRTRIFTNDAEALDFILKPANKVGLVLAGLQGKNGFAGEGFINRLQQEAPQLPIIAMSAYAPTESFPKDIPFVLKDGTLNLFTDLRKLLDEHLPLNKVEAPAAATAVVDASKESKVKSRGTIVYAEDEDLIGNMTVMFLERFDWKVHRARDGQEALRLIEDLSRQGVKVDLLITDNLMDGMSGIALLLTLKQRKLEIPSIFASGTHGINELAKAGINDKHVHVLSKPFAGPDLIALADKLVPKSAAMTSVPGARGSVLIVEDDANLAEMMQVSFEFNGYNVTVVADGQKGLDEMRTGRHIMGFTDNDLGPGVMWGGEMARLKSRDKNLTDFPLVSMSDDQLTEYTGRLPKPFSVVDALNLTKKLALPATGWRRFKAGMVKIKAHLEAAAKRQLELEGNATGRLHYYDTFIGSGEPTKGYAVGVDVSGTNLVVGIIYVDEKGKKTLIKETVVSDKWSNAEKADPRLMFPKMAEFVVQAVKQMPSETRTQVKFWPVGFAFGFPMIQTGKTLATIPTEKEKAIIKDFHLWKLTRNNPENSGTDLDIVELFNTALSKKLEAEGLADQMGVTIVLNDTTAVLMRIKNAIAGFVNGTGFNGAIRFIKKILNGELGGFDIPAEFKTAIDLILSQEPGNPVEKLITGPGLMDNILKQMDIALSKESSLRTWMDDRVPEALKDDEDKKSGYKKWQGEFFLLRDTMIRISQSGKDNNLTAFQASKASEIFTGMTEEELQILVPIFVDAYKRSAYLYGMLLAINLTMADPDQVWFHQYGYSIPNDGSTTEHVPLYQDWLREALALFGYQDVDFKVGDAEADRNYPGKVVFFSFNDPEAKVNVTTLLGAGGSARIGVEDRAAIAPGGIDLKRSDLKMEVEKRDGGIQMVADPAMVARFQAGDFSGVRPIILQIVPAAGQLNSLDI